MTIYKDRSRALDERVQDLLSQMTLEEKVEQLGGWFFPHGKPPGHVENNQIILNDEIKERMRLSLGTISVPNNALTPAEGAMWVNALQHYLIEETRLGIPALICEECAWGHVAPEATAFPAPTSLAASWEPDLARRVFNATARETWSRGGSLAHTPIADLARDPRWGRVRETYGEDPCLASAMVAASVEGLQGGPGGARPGYMAATIKHFAGFGESRGGRQMANVDIGKHVLVNEVLPPYKAAVDAGVEAVMPSYNAIDGLPGHANHWLMTHILRDTWGFNGVTTADYGAIEKMVAMGLAANGKDSARAALKAGLDMDLPHGENYRKLLLDPESENLLPLVDDAVARVLRMKFTMGLFDDPYRDPAEAVELVNCQPHRELAVEAAIKGCVLLKNESDVLPLDPNKKQKIALLGPHAALKQLGDDRRGRVTIIEGMQAWAGDEVEILHERGCNLTTKDDVIKMYLEETGDIGLTELQNMDRDAALSDLYAQDLPQTLPLEHELPMIEKAAACAAEADVAVLCLGESAHLIGENYSPTKRCDRDDITLVGNQIALLEAVHATGTPIVLVLLGGRANALGDLPGKCAAIINMLEPGEARGTALGRLIFGHSEPVGRLPWTIPVTTGSLPVFYNQHKFDTFRNYALSNEFYAFPFGHGLAYTSFELGSPVFSDDTLAAGDSLTIHATIKNTGSREGLAVVQVYLDDEVSSVMRPAKWLATWTRVELKPDEEQCVEIEVPANAFSFIQADETEVIESGWFRVGVGLSSAKINWGRIEVVEGHQQQPVVTTKGSDLP